VEGSQESGTMVDPLGGVAGGGDLLVVASDSDHLVIGATGLAVATKRGLIRGGWGEGLGSKTLRALEYCTCKLFGFTKREDQVVSILASGCGMGRELVQGPVCGSRSTIVTGELHEETDGLCALNNLGITM